MLIQGEREAGDIINDTHQPESPRPVSKKTGHCLQPETEGTTNMTRMIYRIHAERDGQRSDPAGPTPLSIIKTLRDTLSVTLWDEHVSLQARPYEKDAEWETLRFSRRTGRFMMPKTFDPEYKTLLRKHLRDLNAAVRLNVIVRHISNNLIPEGLDVEYVDQEEEQAEFDDLEEKFGDPFEGLDELGDSI
jgi:hypothetical protein